MKLSDILTEEELNEIDRRGFLKGLGAAGVSAAMPSIAKAEPFKHGNYTDQMTGKSSGQWSQVKSDSGDALLKAQWHNGAQDPGIYIFTNGLTLNLKLSGITYGRVKFGGNPVEDLEITMPIKGNYSVAQIKTDGYPEEFLNRVMKFNGQLLVELPVYKSSPRMFKFTIEQDSTTNRYPK